MKSASFSLLMCLVGVACGGCNAQIETVLASRDAGAGGATGSGGPSPDGGAQDAGAGGTVTTEACATAGGVCLPAGSSAPPNRKPADPAKAPCDGTAVCWVPDDTGMVAKNCAADVDCNGEGTPPTPELMGTCFEGMCMCRTGYFVQPSGKCGVTSPVGCASGGGACRQDTAECPGGELEGDPWTNMSCGDETAAVCCHAAATCKTAVDFVCCGARVEPYEPLCINGWRTCDGRAGGPMLRKATCY